MHYKLLSEEEVIWQNYKSKTLRNIQFLTHFVFIAIAIFVFGYAINNVLKTFVQSSPTMVFTVLIAFGTIYLLILRFLVQRRPIYTITNKRIIIYRGILNRDMMSEYLDRILDTEFKQRFSQRLLGIGTIYIRTASDKNSNETKALTQTPHFTDIDRPEDVYHILTEAIENFKNHVHKN